VVLFVALLTAPLTFSAEHNSMYNVQRHCMRFMVMCTGLLCTCNHTWHPVTDLHAYTSWRHDSTAPEHVACCAAMQSNAPRR
jgi:hypothetical protein